MSMGADRKANAQELIREAGGLLERLQRGVALETLGESESSLGAEAVGRDTASTGAEAGAEACQGALTHKCEQSRAVAYPRVVICVSLRMAASAEAPSAPMKLPLILQAKKGQDGNGEKVGVSMGADKKANTGGSGSSAKRPTPAIAASSCP